jgi:hypothetical protein
MRRALASPSEHLQVFGAPDDLDHQVGPDISRSDDGHFDLVHCMLLELRNLRPPSLQRANTLLLQESDAAPLSGRQVRGAASEWPRKNVFPKLALDE